MTKQPEKISQIIEHFEKTMPDAASELQFASSFELLVATMLAAQCTDKRVNMVTPALFERYPTPAAMSEASEEDILTFIKSVSYPNSKAKHLVGMAKMLVEDFAGEVPDSMEGLVKLPGVGRKTANVVLAFAFGQDAMPVDTHVFRVSHRLGLVPDRAKTPDAVEKVLVGKFPREYISRAHHWLLLHGRYKCTARNPQCSDCVLSDICKFFKKRQFKK